MPSDDLMEQWAAAERQVEAASTPRTEKQALKVKNEPKTTPEKPVKEGASEAEGIEPEGSSPADEAGEGRAAGPAGKTREPAAKTPGPTVTVAERVELRIKQREARQKLEAEQAAARKWLDEERAKIAEEGKATRAAKEAFERGDFDEFARALGRKGWTDLNAEMLRYYQDPSYKEVQALKAKLAAQEQAQAERAKAEAEARAHADREKQVTDTRQQVAAYKVSLSQALKSEDDSVLQLAAEDPEFVDAVFAVQQQHWDPERQATLSVDEAAVEVLSSWRKSPLSRLRKKLLNLAIPDDDSPSQAGEPEAAQSGSPDRTGERAEKKPRAKTVTQAGATDTAERKRAGFDESSWRENAIEAMKKALR
jgi:hypothetical protein